MSSKLETTFYKGYNFLCYHKAFRLFMATITLICAFSVQKIITTQEVISDNAHIYEEKCKLEQS